jgi:DNA-binding transcriptional LysR family regulator
MDWEDLKVFLAVAGAGSLAGGARRLAVSQATAWRRVRDFERALEARVFERAPQGYVLTPAGVQLAEALAAVPRAIAAATAQVGKAPDALVGEVRVAAPEFVGIMLARRLPELAKRHPRLTVELLTGSPAAALAARDVDVAIRPERVPAGSLVLERSFRVPFALYASRGYLRRRKAPTAIDDLHGHALVDFDHSLAHIAPKPWLRSGGRGAEIVFRSNSPHARAQAACAGLGLALLPEPFARGIPGLAPALSSADVGELELMLYVSAELRREPRVAAVRELAVVALGAERT